MNKPLFILIATLALFLFFVCIFKDTLFGGSAPQNDKLLVASTLLASSGFLALAGVIGCQPARGRLSR